MKVEFSKKALGLRIREQREKLGLTQEKFAEVYGIPATTLSGYENGGKDIKSSVLVELAGYFNVTPNWLLGYEEKQEEKEDSVQDALVAALGQITDDKVKEMLLVQVQALAKSFS